MGDSTISLRITLRADTQIGPGKAELLKGIRDTGSISAAGRRMTMAAGSVVGTFIGGQLLGIVPSVLLLPALAAILLISAVKVWRLSAH